MAILEPWLGSHCTLLLRCSLTLSFASLGNLFFQNQPAIRSLYISNVTTFEFSSEKICQMIIFKEIFENIIYTNTFTVFKNTGYCWRLSFWGEHLPGMHSTWTHKRAHCAFWLTRDWRLYLYIHKKHSCERLLIKIQRTIYQL